jgi:hypothetical protein
MVAAGADPLVTPTGGALAHHLIVRAYELNQDLAAACEGWSAIPPQERTLVLAQLRYLARLLPMLEGETT